MVPTCEARTSTEPAPVILTRSPLSVAGPETMLKLTGSPDDAEAETVKDPSPYVLLSSGSKVMTWSAGAPVTMTSSTSIVYGATSVHISKLTPPFVYG